ncbi:MAG TPA: hypothetical protein VF601_03915 [Beijerinckiaceae bacterium]|jgi:hypothetical protein
MTRCSASLLPLAGALLAGVLLAPAATAQSMPPPPSMSDPAPAAAPRKAAPKPRAEGDKAKPAGTAAAKPVKPAPARGSTETSPMPRKIDPRDIDDPYGGVGRSERAAPTFTPGGKVGVGGRF